MRGVQYVVDKRGKPTAFVIYLRKHRELWEDFYDRSLSESRRDELRVSWKSVRARLGVLYGQ